jgi:hypothetical protein
MSLYHRFKDRFGTAGVILGVIAIVLAIGGSAIAASGLNGKQKKEVTKIAKKYAGKPGAPGVAGTNGKDGVNGTNGAPGADGEDGAPGDAGADGASVISEDVGPGAECPEGGVEFEVDGSGEQHYACNGADGSPWTAGGTLPEGETETGAWAFGPLPSGVASWKIPVSFPIPLEAGLDGAHVHFLAANGKELNEEGEPVVTPTQCLGSAAAPAANPGHFCAYTAKLTGVLLEFAYIQDPSSPGEASGGTSTVGAIFKPAFLQAGAAGWGTWAVTAP